MINVSCTKKHRRTQIYLKRNEGVNERKRTAKKLALKSTWGTDLEGVGHGKENKTGSPHFTGQLECLSC